MAVSINHDMDQGANFSFSIVAKGSDGLPFSLTGSTASCQMRKYYTSGTATTLQTALTGGTGYILVSLGAAATAAIKPGVYFYDVELQSSNGSVVQRLVQGMITVYPEVTKA
jgi:hypothetical protein